LFRKDFLSGSLNPLWRDVPPDILENNVLYGYDMQTLVSKLGVSAKTIKRRFSAYGFGLKNVYDLTDARAFFLKPIIIEGFKKGLTQEEFFNYAISIGINIFNQYEFIPNKPNPRGDFFRRTVDYIWGTGRHHDARFQVLADYILSIIDHIDITPGEAMERLKKFITFKYDQEFDVVCREVFKKNFREKRDEIYAPLIKQLAIENKDEWNIFTKIAIGVNLCKETSTTEERERASGWIRQYIQRIFGTQVRDELISKLSSEPFHHESLLERVFNYMEDHPLDSLKN